MSLGCLPPKVDLRDYKVKVSPAESLMLPETFALDLKIRVKNQLNVGSCVAHATSSILEYFDHGQTDLSTNFIYGIQNQFCGQDAPGMYIQDACKIVKAYGDMIEADCKGNNEVPKCYSIAEAALSDPLKVGRASFFRIESYYSCLTPQDIKYAIHTYGPVLACVKWHQNHTIDKNNVVQMDKSSPYEYHAIMLYGWDENGFLFQNSWGTMFGKGGRAVIPFTAIAEAKALVDYENPKDDNLHQTNYGKVATIVIKVINKIINLFKK